MWNLKNDTNELIYKTDSWRKKPNLLLPKGKWWGKEKLQVWDYIYTAIYKTGSTV